MNRKDSSDMSGSIDRRKFLTRLAAVGTAVSAAGLASGAEAVSQPANPQEKLTINVFSKHLQFLGYSAMAQTAAEIGFDGVDLTVRPGGHVLPERVEEDLPRAVEAVQSAGLQARMMTTAITDPDDPLTEPVLRTASKLGIKHYRMGYLDYPEEQDIAETLRAYKPRFRKLAQMNKEYGLHGAYQNHAGTHVGGPVWDLWIILEGLDPRWSGCQYDIRHATVEGGQSWPLGLDLMQSHIKNIVAKDFKWVEDENGKWQVQNTPLGEGMVDFEAYLAQLKEYNFSGPVSMHFEYEWVDDEENISQKEHRQKTIQVMQKDLRWLRSAVKQNGLL